MEGRTPWGRSRRSATGITSSRKGTPGLRAFSIKRPGTQGWRTPRGVGRLGTLLSWPRPSPLTSMEPRIKETRGH
eukprot:1916564-Lingulodinium_polyedra.AAC.1